MGGSATGAGPSSGPYNDRMLAMNGERDPGTGVYQGWGGVMPYGGGRPDRNSTGRPPGFAGDDPPAPGTGGNSVGGQTHDLDWLKALAEKYGIAWPGTGTGTGGTGGTGGTTPQTLAWSFPQYSQTWAFTPPAPVYPSLPPPFNKDTYAADQKKKKKYGQGT